MTMVASLSVAVAVAVSGGGGVAVSWSTALPVGSGASLARLGALVVALVCAGLAVALSVPARPTCAETVAARREPLGPVTGRRRPRVAVAVVLVGLTVLITGLLQGTHLAAAAIGATSLLVAGRLVERSREAAKAVRRRQQVVDFSEALVGELKAGQPVLTALERSSPMLPDLAPVLAAARLGADVPTALHRVAATPGADGLSQLAAAWQLCATTGAGLAAAAEQVLGTARADAAALRLVQAEVASARATARLVAVLPVVVLVAADGIGVDPWAFLLGTAAGVLCLGSGLFLLFWGLWWIDRIAESAVRGGG